MSIGAYVCAIVMIHINLRGRFSDRNDCWCLGGNSDWYSDWYSDPAFKGDYLAIATLGMAEIIRVIFLNLEITNGAAGLSGIPRYTNWLWLFAFTAGTIILINNFIKSSHGRACISIREDEIAAESMGINTTKYKVMAFAIGAFAGIAGGSLCILLLTS